jgi:tight adherence protein C
MAISAVGTLPPSVNRASKIGTELTNVLEVQAKEMRRRRLQRAEEQSQKAPIKMLFPMVGCMLPPTFMLLLGPAAVNLLVVHH